MINQNLDYTLIGHNYLTYLLSIGLIKRQKKVLILDDDRFNYGDFYTNSLTEIDLQFIKSFGGKHNIDTLLKLDPYLKKEERYFYVGKKQVLLGRSPGENLMELMRKFPDFFKISSEFQFSENELKKFDEEYFLLCENLANKLINPLKKIKMYQLFLENLNPIMKQLLDSFIDVITSRDQGPEIFKQYLITFIYLTRGFYQSHFSTTGTKMELLHNLMSLISPYYRLDYHQLNQDLLLQFQNLGGEFKKLNLSDLKFHRKSIKGIELLSYDGLITPKKIVFVGGHPLGLPIKFERPKNIYNCLFAELKTNAIPRELVNKKIVFSSALKVSTGRPMFEAHFFEDKIELNIVVLKKNGIKVEFIKNQILSEISEDLKFLFPFLNLEIHQADLKFTHDIFIEEFNRTHQLKNDFKISHKLSELMFFIDPIVSNRPKNVYYLGPYNDGFLGTLSSLIEVQRWQEYI